MPAQQPQAVASPPAACAISGHGDTRTAALEVAGDLFDRMGAGSDLVAVFASYHHRAALALAAATMRQTLAPRVMVGVTAEAVLGADEERDGRPGISAIALRLPGLRLAPWSYRTRGDAEILRDAGAMCRHIGADADAHAVLLLADPFSTPIARLLPAICECRGPQAALPVVGGIASGASQPGHNLLMLDDQASPGGAVGVTIGGPVDVSVVLSQGCRPIGRPLVVTKCTGNVILELGGIKALDALREVAAGLDDPQRALLAHGVLIGTVIDEYRDRFGRGDFLVRNILGFDRAKGAIGVGDVPRVGQTVQFHVRDAGTAHEDLQLLLDAQQLRAPPGAGILFTCNGRGSRLFREHPNDVQTIRARLGELPLAGFFAAGEIGPVAGRSFVHGHTASLALFRTAVT
jgi:small ligand-binding sensory domain FIST